MTLKTVKIQNPSQNCTKIYVECKPFQSNNFAMKPIIENFVNKNRSQAQEVVFKEKSTTSDKMLLEPHSFQETNQVHEDFTWPWNAEIYLDGKLKCNGILLDKRWVLADRFCLGDDRQILRANYAAAVFGSKAVLGIVGPNEQIIRISCLNFIKDSNAVLMELASPVEFNRNILPIFLPDR